MRQRIIADVTLCKVPPHPLHLLQRRILNDSRQFITREILDGGVEGRFVRLALCNRLRLEENDRLDGEPVVLEHLEAILAEHQRLQFPVLVGNIRTDGPDLLGEALLAEHLERIVEDDAVRVLCQNVGILQIASGGELEKDILSIRLENVRDRGFPTVFRLLLLQVHFPLAGVDIQVVRLVGDQHRLLFGKVIESGGVFLVKPHVAVKSLRGREADIDGVWIDALEIIHLHHGNPLPVDEDVGGEEVFCGGLVQEVVLRLLDDVVEIDEEEEVAVALLVEVENQPRHDERLAASRGHVEEHLRGAGALVALVEGDEVAEGIHLIGTQLEGGIQPPRHILR